MKYIMCESHVTGIFPVAFPEHIDHNMIAASIHKEWPGIKITSAGHCTSEGTTYGASTILRLQPAEGDSVFIRQMMKA